jgi:hypothetical protein
MTLSQWLGDRTDGWLASQIGRGCHPSTISRIRRGRKKASLPLALTIEQVSGGEVKAETLPLSKRTRAILRTLRESVSHASPLPAEPEAEHAA